MHTILGATGGGRDLERNVETVADALRRTLRAVAEESIGSAIRPTKLATHLSLDKSLVSRLVRSLRAESGQDLIHYIPSPTGLGMFLQAAESAGVSPERCSDARRAVDDFRTLLEQMPGGRSSLEAWIARGTTDVRQRAEHTAKQAVYRAMSHLLGFHCETVLSALILQPSADGHAVDGIEVSQRTAVRRLRPNTPVALFSIDLTTNHGDGPRPRLEPLEPGADPGDPISYLVPAFCEPELPQVDIHQGGAHHVFALSDRFGSVHHPVTITSAMMIRNGWTRHRSDLQIEDERNYLLHYPCRLVVRDLYIREDLYVGAEPEVRWEFPAPGAAPRSAGLNLPTQLNSLDIWTPIENLGRGPARWSVPALPAHAALVRHAFDRSGWHPERFRGYRARVVYPVPMILMGWKIPLPA